MHTTGTAGGYDYIFWDTLMLKFLVIGDFHYKKNMYASTVADLEAVLQRAHRENVDFVIHTGDFATVCINGFWKVSNEQHYSDTHTFVREKVSGDGSIIGTEEIPLNTLTQSKNTWFFEKPLSAVVEGDDGQINIMGGRTSWRFGVLPPVQIDCVKPEITDRRVHII